MYDEATKVLPPSSELYKKALQAVVRTTFQHACVATREVLRNNPQLITVGQEQLLPGAPLSFSLAYPMDVFVLVFYL